MQALGNGALRNAIISIASKVENAADELKLCKIKMTGTSRDDWLYAASGRQRQGPQRIGCLLGTRGVM